MVKELLLRQAYRLYAAVLAIWGGWSLAWGLLPIDMAASTIGYGWLVIAVAGVPLTGGLFAMRSSLFEGPTREIDRFVNSSLSGWPFVAYAAFLVAWSLVFAGWWSGSLQVSTEIVGYGWLAISAYGAVLTIGLVSTHRSEVMAAVGIRASDPGQL